MSASVFDSFSVTFSHAYKKSIIKINVNFNYLFYIQYGKWWSKSLFFNILLLFVNHYYFYYFIVCKKLSLLFYYYANHSNSYNFDIEINSLWFLCFYYSV